MELVLIQAAAQRDWPKIIEAGALIATAAIAAGGIIYSAIKKIKENSRKAKEAEDNRIKDAVDAAIDKAKLEASHTLEMAQALASHWEQMAKVFEKEKNHEREVHLEENKRFEGDCLRLRADRDGAIAELTRIKVRLEEVVDLNLGLQAQISTNVKAIADANVRIVELQEKARRANGGKESPDKN